MAEKENRGPLFIGIKETGPDARQDAVRVKFWGADEQAYTALFHRGMLGGLVASIIDGVRRLGTPPEGPVALHFLRLTGARQTHRDDGEPAITLILEGALELPLHLSTTGLADLHKALDEAGVPKKPLPPANLN